jgi:hypothetical protein
MTGQPRFLDLADRYEGQAAAWRLFEVMEVEAFSGSSLRALRCSPAATGQGFRHSNQIQWRKRAQGM